jgi:DNA-binding GntR family transcriptional regulator
MGGRGLPLYRRTADEILAMIASGELGLEFTVPEAAKQAGVKDWAARKAAEHLAGRGLIEPHQGTGYRALITPEQAAGMQVDDRPVSEQIADLQRDMTEMRQRLGRMEASLATLTGKPRGGSREQAKAAAGGGR